jgi:hypothetical protein
MAPTHIASHDFRVRVGGKDCTQAYDLSLFNVSAMSFGALSANAIMALNQGAQMGGFAHDTGEGSISRYHRMYGGDLIWEIGSGYFGCRDEQGRFDPEGFARQASQSQVKMIEIKLSQGAKPGHGGVLPAAKMTPEIAEARGVSCDHDCVSPASHSAFSSPTELLAFVQQLRTLSGGKPTGFKLCIGHPWEWFAIVKWVIYGLVEAEEYGITAANIEKLKAESTDPVVMRLLGKSDDTGKLLGLDREWLVRAITTSGNYGEIFERNVGEKTPLALKRGPNAQWAKGGLQYAPPIR